MIVLDEQLNDYTVLSDIQQWYQGKVLTINELRLNSVIKDDNIASLLHQEKHATFVTINYDDFWHVIKPHHNYCIVCLRIDGNNVDELSPVLRELLSLEQFNTKQKRMGKIISVRNGKVNWYE